MTLLSDRVHHELKRRLTLWEYLPGTRMGEEALAAEFGVSRTPVRDALRRLAQEGFLEDTEGWTGYRVRRPDLPASRSCTRYGPPWSRLPCGGWRPDYATIENLTTFVQGIVGQIPKS